MIVGGIDIEPLRWIGWDRCRRRSLEWRLYDGTIDRSTRIFLLRQQSLVNGIGDSRRTGVTPPDPHPVASLIITLNSRFAGLFNWNENVRFAGPPVAGMDTF
jgi:hypothetical protein